MNRPYCSCTQQGVEIMHCDRCNDLYSHMACAGFNVSRINGQFWYCPACQAALSDQAITRANMDDSNYMFRKMISARNLIRACVGQFQTEDGDFMKVACQIREHLHEMETFPLPGADHCFWSGLMGEWGLRQLYTGIISEYLPVDIVRDADQLFNRYCTAEISMSLLKGIIVKQENEALAHLFLDEEYPKKSSTERGDNGLSVGAWWPNRMCALRDGAHGESQCGIAGNQDQGAFSICVTAVAAYADNIDSGDTLHFCGTISPDGGITRHTQMLYQSVANQEVVRVLRGHGSSKSKYAPEEGVRYDGLYKVVSSEKLIDGKTHRFRLVRELGQDPIRFEGAEARPTKYQIELKEKLWIHCGIRKK